MYPSSLHTYFTYVLLLLVAAQHTFGLQRRETETDALASQDQGQDNGQDRLKLHLMTDKGLSGAGAVCLDGSDAGFFFAPALDPAAKNNWQIAFEGGGWCYSEEECVDRVSHDGGHKGSSKTWTTHYKTLTLGGFMSDDCDVNPSFCNFNRVIVPYCDGTSFSGNLENPVEATNALGMPFKMYFRGARILDAVMETLFTMGLQDAHRVILTGFSAGALTVFLHGDKIYHTLQEKAPNLEKFRVVPVSGFFLHHVSQVSEQGEVFDVESKVYKTQLGYMVNISNSTGALSERCKSAQTEAWTCVLAPVAYSYMEAPTFLVNSAIDMWQIVFLIAAAVPPSSSFKALLEGVPPAFGGSEAKDAMNLWRMCFMSSSLQGCSSDQIKKLRLFTNDFERMLREQAPEKGNGAFIHSCPLHDEAIDPEWNSVIVNGLSMQQAVHDWWDSDAEHPTIDYTTLDCHVTEDFPYACNPTCPLVIDE